MEMQLVTKKLSEIRPYERNPRRNDPAVASVVTVTPYCWLYSNSDLEKLPGFSSPGCSSSSALMPQSMEHRRGGWPVWIGQDLHRANHLRHG